MTPASETIGFKPYHDTPYQKFFVIRSTSDGKIKRIGKMLAPNAELAEAKARNSGTKNPPAARSASKRPSKRRRGIGRG